MPHIIIAHSFFGILQTVSPRTEGPKHSLSWMPCVQPTPGWPPSIHAQSVFAGRREECRNQRWGPRVGPCPRACENRTAPGCTGDEGAATLAFPFLVITSLFSGNLMFSVTCTFSHWDLALVWRKQSGFSLIFFFSVCEEFCCWKTQPVCG